MNRDILIDPEMLKSISEVVRILDDLGLDGWLMPQSRPEFTMRVFSLNGQEPELIKRLKAVRGVIKILPS
ncbi:MAG: hypothetical protein PHU56_03985 [Candidatus Pacebacteria bacterium]|nr:hypothetical protein [Candidatus Paceibacterota bacterium]